jgi:Zn-dependent peptidase ImmA (M78 family)/transcriptional regulator with XRE-family HTH domain
VIHGDRIRHARELAALTQTELAREAGTTQPVISAIEKGTTQPTEAVLTGVAVATHFPVEWFARRPTVEPPEGTLRFRARASLTTKDRRQAQRCGQSVHEHVLLMRAELEVPEVALHEVPGAEPRRAANEARAMLGLPARGPIPHLMTALEQAGVVLLGLPLNAARHDAFAYWHRDGQDIHPVVSVLAGAPGDRLRFSTAHEFGHILMHCAADTGLPARTAEDQADTFASEFLAPVADMREEMPSAPTLKSLMLLKRRWGVSLQFLIRRARDVGAIDEHRYTSLFKQLSARGWTKQQPVVVPVEKPRAYRRMAELLYGDPVDIGALSRQMAWLPSFCSDVLAQHASVADLPARRPLPSNVLRLQPRKSRS